MGLVSGYLKNSYNSTIKNRKWAKKLYSSFSRGGVHQGHEKIFNIIGQQGNANKNTMKYYFIPVRVPIIKF